MCVRLSEPLWKCDDGSSASGGNNTVSASIISSGLILSLCLLSDTGVSLLSGSGAGRAPLSQACYGEDSPAFIPARLFIGRSTRAYIVLLRQCVKDFRVCNSCRSQATHLLSRSLCCSNARANTQLADAPALVAGSISRAPPGCINHLNTVTAHTCKKRQMHAHTCDPPPDYRPHKVSSITDKCSSDIDRVTMDHSCLDL